MDVSPDRHPIAIGGVGGSGTRLIAELVRSMGVHTGNDLNAANDTLWFTLLFKRLAILRCDDGEFAMALDALVAGLRGGSALDEATRLHLSRLCTDGRPGHSTEWLEQRARSLTEAAALPAHGGLWGWKEPNTHLVIERLWRYLPNLRYVHVVRHGVDMAFSHNQNQVALWGPHVLGNDAPVSPRRSLRYWCQVHRRMQALLDANPERMYWLDYDGLCRNPRQGFEGLRRFLALPDASTPDLDQVHAPRRPRHADQDLGCFDRADLEYVSQLGYEVVKRVQPDDCDADA